MIIMKGEMLFESGESREGGHMKRVLAVLVLITLLAFLPCMAGAADVGPIFTRPLIGMSTGAMLGFLAALVTGEPEDHGEYVSIGLGVGFAFGLALGIYDVVNASAQIYQRETDHEKIYGMNIVIPLK
jgi:hypothetical protein